MNDIEKLKSAIEYCDDVIKRNDGNCTCVAWHQQLKDWLIELRGYRMWS